MAYFKENVCIDDFVFWELFIEFYRETNFKYTPIILKPVSIKEVCNDFFTSWTYRRHFKDILTEYDILIFH